MPVQFHCPHCRLPITVAEQFAGTKSNCPKCKESIAIPGKLSFPVSGDPSLTSRDPQYDYRSIAIRYRWLKIMWLCLWIVFVTMFLFIPTIANNSEAVIFIIVFGLPLCLFGLFVIGLLLFWKKRKLRSGGYFVGFLGTSTRTFNIDCLQCDFSFYVPDILTTNPSPCPICEIPVIPISTKNARISSEHLKSEQWQYDYLSIVRWDRRMMLSLLLLFLGIAVFITMLVFLYSMQGGLGLFLHQVFMLLGLYALLVSILSILVFFISGIKLIGLLRLHLSIFFALIMGMSIIGLILYIPILFLKIKFRTMFVLHEQGYTGALWGTGMKQFSGRNTVDEVNQSSENQDI